MPYVQTATPNGGQTIVQTESSPGNTASSAPNLTTLADPSIDTTTVAVVAAAGTTQATATALTAADSTVTSGTSGVALQKAANRRQRVENRSGAAVNVYPPVGGKIEAGTVNAAVSLANGANAFFMTPDGVQFYQS